MRNINHVKSFPREGCRLGDTSDYRTPLPLLPLLYAIKDGEEASPFISGMPLCSLALLSVLQQSTPRGEEPTVEVLMGSAGSSGLPHGC